MPKRKKVFTKPKVRAKKMKEARQNETEEQWENRRSNNRERMKKLRKNQTDQTRSRGRVELQAFHYDCKKKYIEHPNVIIGKMDTICKYCNERKFQGETAGMCWSNGKVNLPPLNIPPPELLAYMNGETPDSNHFLQNIRRYNCCFQMTSFGATLH
ncbi:unnamed protein product [Psylliodes chrysocephalus]|uniref:Uncharacterized protein n=1 Tax=Psylliodes chrysocephalus TaxID=3402493 RepID=A0A9P0DAH3_9CUCU|nr:unnamed protein product [Psylliodes chrysocephala]